MKRISPTVVEIHHQALRYNYRQLKKRIPANVKTLCVVKSNAYGHGAASVSRVLQEEGADFFGVGTIDEALELREAGVKRPILILLGLLEDHFDALVRYQFTPVIYDLKTAERLHLFLSQKGKSLSIHVKVDTGMTRLGVLPKEVGSFCERLKRFSSLVPAGLMTHLADAEDDTFTVRQLKRFEEARREFQKYFPRAQILHTANSQAVIDRRISAKNEDLMVRLGIALYGAYPSEKARKRIELKPVLSWKTRIVTLKRIPSQTPVSYGRTFRTKKESLIGVLPVGYADGYMRILSNRSRVLVHGKKIPIVGRVCMDMVMVDVTKVPQAKVGDEVVLIGSQGKERITAEDLAAEAKTISYEIFCRIAERIPRVIHS